jgi:hypothetical protein
VPKPQSIRMRSSSHSTSTALPLEPLPSIHNLTSRSSGARRTA